MDKDFLIQTTNNLYRLTLFFPKKEPLRYKMREVADDVLAQFFNGSSLKKIEDGPLSSMLEVLNGFFEVAKQQNWVSLSDLLVVQTAYLNLMPERGLTPLRQSHIISERQKKILELLKEKDRVQVHQAQQIFPQLTKRTLRRDFEQLLNQGLIQRVGERNEISYQIMVGQT